ncbi:MAG: type II toxin-antitoxin system HicA family toxin [bacterium]|nr:type II toxin-antitoxin system HicA family toxin [bacterium]
MKRTKLIKYLEGHGCRFFREGSRHSLYRNPENEHTTSVPRHSEIVDILADKICKDLGIPRIRSGK